MEFVTAASLDEALDSLSRLGSEAAVVAGGTAVLYQLSAGMIRASRIVHVERLDDLSYVERDGAVRIGALTTMRTLAESPDFASLCGGLVTAAASCGGWQTQFVATVGGNICNASPGADLAPPLLVHDARVTLASAERGARSMRLAAFFTGHRQTAREPDELVTEIAFDTPLSRTADNYVKVRRRGAMELPIVGVATRVTLDESGETIADIRIAACAVGPVPFRADEAEDDPEGCSRAACAPDRGRHRPCRARDLLQRCQGKRGVSACGPAPRPCPYRRAVRIAGAVGRPGVAVGDGSNGDADGHRQRARRAGRGRAA